MKNSPRISYYRKIEIRKSEGKKLTLIHKPMIIMQFIEQYFKENYFCKEISAKDIAF